MLELFLGKNPDCKLAMDFESFGSLNNEEINQIAIAFLQRLQEVTGKEVIVYSDEYNANNTFNESVAYYALWVAQYEVENLLLIIIGSFGRDGNIQTKEKFLEFLRMLIEINLHLIYS